MAADGLVVNGGEVAQVADNLRPTVYELGLEEGDRVGVVVPQESNDGFVLLEHKWGSTGSAYTLPSSEKQGRGRMPSEKSDRPQ